MAGGMRLRGGEARKVARRKAQRTGRRPAGIAPEREHAGIALTERTRRVLLSEVG